MYELQVEGMSCSHCADRVTRSVMKIDGAAKVEVDLAANKVRVQTKAGLEDVSSAIAQAGYPVKSTKAV